jgi:hypothetical protein
VSSTNIENPKQLPAVLQTPELSIEEFLAAAVTATGRVNRPRILRKKVSTCRENCSTV